MIAARTVFFISDGTGITAETLAHSLLSQFEDQHFRQVRMPFVDTVDKARDCVAQILEAAARDGRRPIVVSTLVFTHSTCSGVMASPGARPTR